MRRVGRIHKDPATGEGSCPGCARGRRLPDCRMGPATVTLLLRMVEPAGSRVNVAALGSRDSGLGVGAGYSPSSFGRVIFQITLMPESATSRSPSGVMRTAAGLKLGESLNDWRSTTIAAFPSGEMRTTRPYS